MTPEYRRRAWRLFRAYRRRELRFAEFVWLRIALAEQARTWPMN